MAGLAAGVVAAALIAFGFAGWAILAIALSRLADGLDGAIACSRGKSDFGGYLDITCDFLFYGLVPLGFVFAAPALNGAAGAFLLCRFYVNGSSFLGFAVLAERRGMESSRHGAKSLYFTGGLLEGTETILFFLLICLYPGLFIPATWIFCTLCFITALSRLLLAAHIFRNATGGDPL